MSTGYAICDKNNNTGFGDGWVLNAKTDIGARRSAAKMAREKNIEDYYIYFARTEDGCIGTIDI